MSSKPGEVQFLREHFGNPSSDHVFGRCAGEAVELSRSQLAALFGSAPDEVIFTSGGTEANNLAIRGATARSARWHIVTTAIEHPTTARPVAWLEQHGWLVMRLPVDALGRVQVRDLEENVDLDTALVTVMHSNNETGVLQPVRAASRVARSNGALVHTDAARSLGKVSVSVQKLGVDLLSVAGHKLYAPKGIGALYIRGGTAVPPFLLGAGHEQGLRPGTENVASTVGLGAACEIARRELDREGRRVGELRDRLWAQLAEAIPDLALNGSPQERLPNTVNVRFPRISATALLAAVPEVAASTGAACHDGHDMPSAILLAMGVPAVEALGSVRLTLERLTTVDDVDRAARALITGWNALVGR